MSSRDEDTAVIEMAASVWAVRSQGPELREADIVALTEWLEASDNHADAYRRALSLWLSLTPHAEASNAEIGAEISNVVKLHPRRQDPARRAAFTRPFVAWYAGGAVAAALALVVCLPLLTAKPVPAVVYETAKGERQSFTLADGTVLMLNTGSRVSVRMGQRERTLNLEHGEVAVQVAHDANRPFRLDTADVRITDVGTEFNVQRDDNAVRVTVKSGVVRVQPTQTGGQTVTLRAGDMGVHSDGAITSQTGRADPQQAFAWQSAHAIYRDQPLSVVVKDLNRYFDKPIIVDDETGKLPLTAILTLDSEGSVVGRLEEFLPIDATQTDEGIVLRRADHGRNRGT